MKSAGNYSLNKLISNCNYSYRLETGYFLKKHLPPSCCFHLIFPSFKFTATNKPECDPIKTVSITFSTVGSMTLSLG